jgi:hypothetical protein
MCLLILKHFLIEDFVDLRIKLWFYYHYYIKKSLEANG